MKNNYISLSCRTKNGQTRAIILREVLGLPRPFGTLPLIKRENEGGVARVDYGKPLSQTMDEYDAALEAGVQSGLKTILSAREQEAVDRMEEAIAEEEESELRFSTTLVDENSEVMFSVDGIDFKDGRVSLNPNGS